MSNNINNSRTYKLANKDYKNTIDLTKYQKKIKESVQAVIPNALVIVDEHSYTVSPIPTRAESTKIGRNLAKTSIGKYSKHTYSLFRS